MESRSFRRNDTVKDEKGEYGTIIDIVVGGNREGTVYVELVVEYEDYLTGDTYRRRFTPRRAVDTLD